MESDHSSISDHCVDVQLESADPSVAMDTDDVTEFKKPIELLRQEQPDSCGSVPPINDTVDSGTTGTADIAEHCDDGNSTAPGK